MAGSRNLRQIVVDDAVYLYGVAHRHGANGAPEPRCQEIFTAYLDGHPRSPLRVRFEDAAGRKAGYPERGIVWLTARLASLNLSTPGVAARIIRQARAEGWDPVRAGKPFVIVDGFATFLEDDRAGTVC